MKGFAGGRLFDEKTLAVRRGCLTPVQCIHYALTRPAVCSILCGYDTEGAGRRGRRLRDRRRPRKRTTRRVLANAPFHSYRGQCTYCGHCKPCAAEHGYRDDQQVLRSCDHAARGPGDHAQSHYELLGHTASECIGCHACEARCPFGVPIARRMEQAAALFGR